MPSAGGACGTYIDVGAGHPIADNVSFWFYERGWRGIVVEPQAELAGLYGRLRPRDTAVCGLVGRQDGEIDFHVVDRLHGFSTTVEHVARQAKKFGVDYRTVRMPVVTLARLCEQHGVDEIDFLKIDVEGSEADVLHGGDWRRYRPKVIVIEAVMPGSGEPAWGEWEPFLLAKGYRFALFDTLNRFYVARGTSGHLRPPAVRAGAVGPGPAHVRDRAGAREPEPSRPRPGAASSARGFWASLPYLDRDLIAAILRSRPHRRAPSRRPGLLRRDRYRGVPRGARPHRLRL